MIPRARGVGASHGREVLRLEACLLHQRGGDGFGRVGSLIGNREALIERFGEGFQFTHTLDGGTEGRL